MNDYFFSPLERGGSDHERRFLGSPRTAGPWATGLQHGGPPNALAVAEAERTLLAETGRADLVALRLAADFVGPVPVGEVTVSTRIVRAARSAALVHVSVRAADRDCLLVRIWFVRSTDPVAVDAREGAPPRLPAPPAVPGLPAVPDRDSDLGMEFGYGASLSWRFVHGSFTRPGPAVVWVRPGIGLYEGYELSGLARVVLVADSASGVSAELDWNDWSFQNVDLDVHLARPFTGDWVLLDAQTRLGTHGAALARSSIGDELGMVGAGLQTLVVNALPHAGPGPGR